MTALSDYLEATLIDHVLRNTPYTSPGTAVYVALFTTDPTDADTGTEVAGNGYARQQVTVWDDPAGTGQTANTNDITFPAATGAWGTVTHVGIYDAATLGNLLFHGPLSASKAVDTDDVLSIAAGNLTVTLD